MSQTASRKGKDIKQGILDQLSWDTGVDESNIRIKVADGTATLTGSVPSFFDRQHAEIDALNTPGVERVINRLTISYPPSSAPLTDLEIEKRIVSILRWSSGIDPAKVTISVKEGTVILSGAVPSYRDKIRVAYLAANITGVTGIRNRVAVTPAGTREDEEAARRVIETLSRTQGTDIDAMDIECENGAVTLFGSIGDTAARTAAGDAAAAVPGVQRVDNRLTIL